MRIILGNFFLLAMIDFLPRSCSGCMTSSDAAHLFSHDSSQEDADRLVDPAGAILFILKRITVILLHDVIVSRLMKKLVLYKARRDERIHLGCQETLLFGLGKKLYKFFKEFDHGISVYVFAYKIRHLAAALDEDRHVGLLEYRFNYLPQKYF